MLHARSNLDLLALAGIAVQREFRAYRSVDAVGGRCFCSGDLVGIMPSQLRAAQDHRGRPFCVSRYKFQHSPMHSFPAPVVTV